MDRRFFEGPLAFDLVPGRTVATKLFVPFRHAGEEEPPLQRVGRVIEELRHGTTRLGGKA